MTRFDDAQIADGLNPLFPPGFLKVVGFLIPADETTRELIDWYEEIHAPNASFLWPHMVTYRRNFILSVEAGPVPAYRVVTEFIWKSEQDKLAAAALFGTPAAAATVNERYPSWMKPLDIPETHGLVPVTPVALAAPSANDNLQLPLRRRIVLLEQNSEIAKGDMDNAVQEYVQAIATALGVPVSLDLCRQATRWPATRAVVYINDQTSRALPTVEPDVLKIANIFSVETRQSAL